MTLHPNFRKTRALAATSAFAACMAAAAFAGPAGAATTNGYNCHAEALNASLFNQPALRPLVAGPTTALCADENGGLPNAGPSTLPDLLALDGAYARTRITPSAATAPAYQTATAESGVADAKIDKNGAVIRVQAVEAASKATCVNGQVSYSSTGHVAKLFLFGQEIPLNDGLSQLITGLDGVTKVLVHLRLNEVTQDSSGYTFRALHVTVPQDGSILNISVGENHLNGVGSPCTDFTGTGGPENPNPPNDKPVVGLPYGGANVVNLQDIAGYQQYRRLHSLCVSSPSFGRKIALVGNNKRNNITGSKFDDRIFAYGARDKLNGGASRDCIEAGSGSDIVNGGTGNDALYGRAGRDYLDAGAGADRIFGGSGVDTIVTGSGRDRVDGGDGNDKIFTRDGRDVVKGGKGNDRIFVAARGKPDKVSCGPGRDSVRADIYDHISKDCEVVTIAGPIRRR
jgi:hypothetical protein